MCAWSCSAGRSPRAARSRSAIFRRSSAIWQALRSQSRSWRRSARSCRPWRPRPSACSTSLPRRRSPPIPRCPLRRSISAAMCRSATCASAMTPSSRSSTTGAATCPPAERSPSSGRPVPARPRWSSCSCAFTMWMPVRSSSTGATCATMRAATCAAPSAWCCRTRGCLRARSWKTSATAARMRPMLRSSRRPRPRAPMPSSARCPAAIRWSSTRTRRMSHRGKSSC